MIIVASVSCIYGIGSAETYRAMTQSTWRRASELDRARCWPTWWRIQYQRNDVDFHRGTFRVRGDVVEIFPAHLEDRAWRCRFFGDEIEAITEIDPLTGEKTDELRRRSRIYANRHYVTPRPTLQQAMQARSRPSCTERLDELVADGKLLEAQRLEQRTIFDLEMLEAIGFCTGIENYSRYLTGRAPGEPPPTLFDYFPDNAIV